MTPLAVVGRNDEIRSVLRDEIENFVFGLRVFPLVRIEYRYRLPALRPHHLHRRDIGIPVAEVDHSGEGQWALFQGHPAIHSGIVPTVEDPLVDAEEELRLRRVVDCDGGPHRMPVHVVQVAGCEDPAEVPRDGGGIDHLLIPRRDDVVLQLEPALPGVYVDPIEPLANAVEQLRPLPVGVQHGAGDRGAQRAGTFDQAPQVNEDFVGVVLLCDDLPGIPEIARAYLQLLGDEAVSLNAAGCEGSVEIVGDGRGNQLRAGALSLGLHWPLRLPRAPASISLARPFVCGRAPTARGWLASPAP